MEKDIQNKLLQTFLNSFNAMPGWLKNTLIVSLVIGVFYFGFIRKEIIYSKEKQTTSEIFSKINSMNSKIEKIEDIRQANEEMLFNIEEVRGIAQLNSELHRNHNEILIFYLKKVLTPDEYVEMRNKLDDETNNYRNKVNVLFSNKSKKHLENNQE